MNKHQAFNSQIQSVNKGGRICTQFAVTRDDADYTGYGGKSRAEILPGNDTDALNRRDLGRFSILLPEVRDCKNPSVVLSWHGHAQDDGHKPDYNGVPFYIDAWPVGAKVGAEYAHLRMVRTKSNGDLDTQNEVRKMYTPGVWTDLFYDMLWSDSNGYIKIWEMNGEEIRMLFEHHGANCTYQSPYYKYGCYHGNWSGGGDWDKVYIDAVTL